MVVLTAKDIAADQAEKKAGILCVFQVLFCEELREENRCQAIRDFRRRPKKYIALQSVWVQCDTLGVSHICIFPSDGTNRIRFTGKGYQAHSQPDASGSPKTYLLLRSEIIIAQIRCLSRKNYAAGLLASQKKQGRSSASPLKLTFRPSSRTALRRPEYGSADAARSGRHRCRSCSPHGSHRSGPQPRRSGG